MEHHFQRHHKENYSGFGESNLDIWARLVCGFLTTLTVEVGLKSVRDLLSYVQKNKAFEEGARLTDLELSVFKEFALRSRTLFPQKPSVAPPNSISLLLHLRVMAAVLCTLPTDKQKFLKELEKTAPSLAIEGGKGGP